ncbi:hypothetical protein D3C78_1347920 [compost metagenome]
MIWTRHRDEPLCVSIQTQQQPTLSGDEYLIAGAADGVEVEKVRIIHAVIPGLPGHTTIIGFEHQIEGTDYETFLLVAEPHIKKRQARSLLSNHLGLTASGLDIRIILR